MFIYFYNSLVLWGSCLFRKIRTPFAERLPVLLSQEGESTGLQAPHLRVLRGPSRVPLVGTVGTQAGAPACCSFAEDSALSAPCFLILGKARLCWKEYSSKVEGPFTKGHLQGESILQSCHPSCSCPSAVHQGKKCWDGLGCCVIAM